MGSAGMYGDAVERVLAAVGDDYCDAAGGDAEFDGEYGAELLREHELKLYLDGFGDGDCGAVCGCDDDIAVRDVGGGVDSVAVPVGAGNRA